MEVLHVIGEDGLIPLLSALPHPYPLQPYHRFSFVTNKRNDN